MLFHLVLGLALGVASGLLPGPCGLAVMTTASTRGLHRALAVAAGGGLGDGTYALVGTIAVAPLTRYPLVPTLLQLASGIALITFGLARLVLGRAQAPPSRRTQGDTLAGFALGIASVLSNPGALLSWAAVVGAVLSGGTIEGGAMVVGIGAGSALWLTIVAFMTRTSRATALVHRVTSFVSALLIASGALALARAAHAVLAS